MASFYGGKKGQDFVLRQVLPSVQQLKNYLADNNKVGLNEFVMISYGLVGDTTFGENQNNDKNFGNYNATLWQKKYYPAGKVPEGIVADDQGNVGEKLEAQDTGTNYFILVSSFSNIYENDLVLKGSEVIASVEAFEEAFNANNNTFLNGLTYSDEGIEDTLSAYTPVLDILYNDINTNELIGVTYYLDTNYNARSYWYYKYYNTTGEKVWGRIRTDKKEQENFILDLSKFTRIQYTGDLLKYVSASYDLSNYALRDTYDYIPILEHINSQDIQPISIRYANKKIFFIFTGEYSELKDYPNVKILIALK